MLTDQEFFGGSAADLRAARAAVPLPVLRKDFTVTAADVCDARIMGADCVLLIAAALDDRELTDFHALARELGLDALVEIHDEAELGAGDGGRRRPRRGQPAGPRDVRGRHGAGRPHGLAMPADVVRVAESGVRGPADAAALAAAGYHAVLVGESLVTAGEPAKAVAALRHAR